MKVSLSKSIIATKRVEESIDDDLWSVMERFGPSDDQAMTLIQDVQSVFEMTMGSLRHKLLKLEHDLNTLADKRKAEEDAG